MTMVNHCLIPSPSEKVVHSAQIYKTHIYIYIYGTPPQKKPTLLLFLAVFTVNSAYFDVDFLSTTFR